MLEEVAFLLAFFLLGIASYYDFKSHEVPDFLCYLFLFLGLVFFAVNLFTHCSNLVLLSAFSAVVFSLAMKFFGGWALGDVFIFSGISLMLPEFNGVAFFPFLVFSAGVLSSAPFVLGYCVFEVFKNDKAKQSFLSLIRRRFFKELGFALVLFLVFLFIEGVETGIGAALGYFLVFFAVSFYKASKDFVLREVKKVNELMEGDIPAVSIDEKGRIVKGFSRNLVVSSMNADGLTLDQIKKLKSLGVSELVVRKSIPFIPLLWAGLVLAGLIVFYIRVF